MAKTTQELELKITGTDAGATGTVAKVGKEVEKLRREQEKLRKEQEREAQKSSTMNRLKGSLSGSSDLGDIADSLKGAGLVAGLVGVGEALQGATGGIIALKKEFQEADLSAGEMFSKVADGIPIVSQFAAAGRNIREIFTGEQAAIDQINKDTALTNEAVNTQIRLLEIGRQHWNSHLETIRNIRNELAKIGKEGFALTAENMRQQGEAAQREASGRADGRKKQITDATAGTRAKLRKELDGVVDEDESNQGSAGKARRFSLGSQLRALDKSEAEQLRQVEAEKQREMIELARVSQMEATEAQGKETDRLGAERRAALEAGEKQVADARAAARQAAMRAAGEDLEADLDILKRAHAKELEEIQAQAKKKAALLDLYDKESRGQVDQQTAALTAATDERYGAEEKAKRDAAAAAAVKAAPALEIPFKEIFSAVGKLLGFGKEDGPDKSIRPPPGLAALEDGGAATGIGASLRERAMLSGGAGPTPAPKPSEVDKKMSSTLDGILKALQDGVQFKGVEVYSGSGSK